MGSWAAVFILLKTFYVCYSMRIKSILALLAVVIGGALFTLFETGCANIVPPTGGPRDTLPPVIVSVLPENKTLHFDSKEIKIVFDEFVELEDIFRNLLISPFPKLMPEVKRKLRTVTVKLKDSLQPNTTYVFNFARAIKDLNEGNRAKDLLYVVSTGSYFDSLQLSGNVKMAKTGKADSTLSVMLYKNLEDSAVMKERPSYITRVDTTGTFFFRFLAPGKYRLYAMKDESGSYMYNGEQIFAFADSPVVVSPTPPEPIRLLAYEAEKPVEAKPYEPTDADKKEKRLKFTTNLSENKMDVLKPFVLNFSVPVVGVDFRKMALSMDSTYKPVTGHKFSLDSTHRTLTMNMPWQLDTTYHLVLQKDFATDSLGKQLLKPDTISFRTKKRYDYGQAKITFVNIDMSKNPVLLLMKGEAIEDSFRIPPNQIIDLQYVNPGTYDMQILYDINKNSKWDPGDLFRHKQPERMEAIQRKLDVKPISTGYPLDFEIKWPAKPAG